MHGNNIRKLPEYLPLPQTSKKCHVFCFNFYVFSSTKSENKRAEQVLPGAGCGDVGGLCFQREVVGKGL
jgi:hypothetical protein